MPPSLLAISIIIFFSDLCPVRGIWELREFYMQEGPDGYCGGVIDATSRQETAIIRSHYGSQSTELIYRRNIDCTIIVRTAKGEKLDFFPDFSLKT